MQKSFLNDIKFQKKNDVKVITRYNDNINSIDSKLYIDLIHYIIDSILSRRRSIFEFSFNYYFENKSLFELKPSIFNRINQINQIKFDQKYEYSMKKSLSTFDIIINKLKRDRLLRYYLFTFTFTLINHKRKFN